MVVGRFHGGCVRSWASFRSIGKAICSVQAMQDRRSSRSGCAKLHALSTIRPVSFSDMGGKSTGSVVVPGGENLHALCADLIDEPMLPVDPVGPSTSKIHAQRFGFADTLKRLAYRSLHQFEDPQRPLPVRIQYIRSSKESGSNNASRRSAPVTLP